MSNPDINLFRDEEFEEVKLTPEKVVCLGLEFESDDARRAYFREELRKKLPELRQIEGFPIGEDEDIINLSDPPYYTACPNPWLNDFVAEWEQEKVELERQGKRSAEFEVDGPYTDGIKVGKNSAIYNAHTYHTKVPHQIIMRYILHYTQPGDIVLWGYGSTVTHSSLYVGNGTMIHAANPGTGVIISNIDGWLRGSGTQIVSVRRIQ